jgi:hypothetical protein
MSVPDDKNPLRQLSRLVESHGELKPGHGLITGVIALSLGILCFWAVLAFHFPQYLTTPELRKSYDAGSGMAGELRRQGRHHAGLLRAAAGVSVHLGRQAGRGAATPPSPRAP